MKVSKKALVIGALAVPTIGLAMNHFPATTLPVFVDNPSSPLVQRLRPGKPFVMTSTKENRMLNEPAKFEDDEVEMTINDSMKFYGANPALGNPQQVTIQVSGTITVLHLWELLDRQHGVSATRMHKNVYHRMWLKVSLMGINGNAVLERGNPGVVQPGYNYGYPDNPINAAHFDGTFDFAGESGRRISVEIPVSQTYVINHPSDVQKFVRRGNFMHRLEWSHTELYMTAAPTTNGDGSDAPHFDSGMYYIDNTQVAAENLEATITYQY